MRAHTRRRGMAVLITAVLLTAACGGDSDEESTDTKKEAADPVTLGVSPAPGTAVKGNVVTLDLSASGVEITPADGDSSGETGHFAVFVDRDAHDEGEVIPVEPGIIHSVEKQVEVDGLGPGQHKFEVVLADGDNTAFGPAPATTEIMVEGPSVIANAQAKNRYLDSVPIDLQLVGLTVAAADGDTSGQTGHFHLFVDRPPVAPGELIPTGDPNIVHTVESKALLPGLAIGPHVVWVVVGDGVHTALNPPVRARVAFTVEKAK